MINFIKEYICDMCNKKTLDISAMYHNGSENSIQSRESDNMLCKDCYEQNKNTLIRVYLDKYKKCIYCLYEKYKNEEEVIRFLHGDYVDIAYKSCHKHDYRFEYIGKIKLKELLFNNKTQYEISQAYYYILLNNLTFGRTRARDTYSINELENNLKNKLEKICNKYSNFNHDYDLEENKNLFLEESNE